MVSDTINKVNSFSHTKINIYRLFSGVRGDKVGLAITQAMTMTGLLQWGIRHSVEVTNQLMSVERVLEYSSLDSEEKSDLKLSVPELWPVNGKIEFRQVTLRYSPHSEPILRNISFIIKPEEKVGIVGRTGMFL